MVHVFQRHSGVIEYRLGYARFARSIGAYYSNRKGSAPQFLLLIDRICDMPVDGGTVIGDAERIPLQAGSCDLVISIHVLEHVGDDHAAIAELYRVLQPGGRAIVSVPLQFDQPTMEDPAVTDPAERKRLYGEEEHLRYYGTDLTKRLAAAGFEVELDLAADLPAETCVRNGLRKGKNSFYCRKSDLH